MFYDKMHKGAEMLHEAQLFLTKVQQSAFYSAAPHATHTYCGQIFLRKIFGGKYIYIYIEFCKRNCHKVLGSVCLCHKVVLFEAFCKKPFCDFSFEAFCKKLHQKLLRDTSYLSITLLSLTVLKAIKVLYPFLGATSPQASE